MALRFKSFSQPDLLKRIRPANLMRLLEPHRTFLETKGFLFPPGNGEEIDYLALGGILAQPDEDMSSDLVEALHLIENFSGDERFDEVLDLAHQSGLLVEPDATVPDLATQLYLHDPQVLERKEREHLFEKRKNFESYRASKPDEVLPMEDLPADLLPLEQALDQYFQSKKRGVGYPGLLVRSCANFRSRSSSFVGADPKGNSDLELLFDAHNRSILKMRTELIRSFVISLVLYAILKNRTLARVGHKVTSTPSGRCVPQQNVDGG